MIASQCEYCRRDLVGFLEGPICDRCLDADEVPSDGDIYAAIRFRDSVLTCTVSYLERAGRWLESLRPAVRADARPVLVVDLQAKRVLYTRGE